MHEESWQLPVGNTNVEIVCLYKSEKFLRRKSYIRHRITAFGFATAERVGFVIYCGNCLAGTSK